MTNPSGRPSSAIIAMMAASVAVATIQVGAADAAQECLTAPQAGTPAGQHWFYRLEAGTKRHCWYLGDKAKTSSQVPTSTSARRAAPDPSATTNNALAGSTADARAEFQMPQAFTEKDKDLAFPSESPASTGVPDGSEQAAPARTSTANPAPSSAVPWLPQPNGVAPPAGTPSATISIEQSSAPQTNTLETNTPETNTGATTETTVAATAIAPTEQENSAIGSTPPLVGLALLLLGALILLGLSGRAIYRRVEERAKWRSYRSFGRRPLDGERPATQSQLDVDDNLRRMRDLLARLKHEAQPQSDDAVARLYSGQP